MIQCIIWSIVLISFVKSDEAEHKIQRVFNTKHVEVTKDPQDDVISSINIISLWEMQNLMSNDESYLISPFIQKNKTKIYPASCRNIYHRNHKDLIDESGFIIVTCVDLSLKKTIQFKLNSTSLLSNTTNFNNTLRILSNNLLDVINTSISWTRKINHSNEINTRIESNFKTNEIKTSSLITVTFTENYDESYKTMADFWDDLKYDGYDVEDTITDLYDDMLSDVKYMVQRLKQFLQSLLETRKLELEEICNFASNQIDKEQKLNTKCKEEIKQTIQNLKHTGISSFFTCSNLTDALVETGSIIVFSLELTANITDNFNAIFGRLAKCDSDNFLEKPVCWFKAVLDVKADIEKDMNDVSFFKTKVAKLVKDISANVEFCAHPPKKNLTIAVEHAMATAKDCQAALTAPIQHFPVH